MEKARKEFEERAKGMQEEHEKKVREVKIKAVGERERMKDAHA